MKIRVKKQIFEENKNNKITKPILEDAESTTSDNVREEFNFSNLKETAHDMNEAKNILATFILSNSLLDNITFPTMPANTNALLKAAAFPDKFKNIHSSVDNDPAKTLANADDFAKLCFAKVKFNIVSDITDKEKAKQTGATDKKSYKEITLSGNEGADNESLFFNYNEYLFEANEEKDRTVDPHEGARDHVANLAADVISSKGVSHFINAGDHGENLTNDTQLHQESKDNDDEAKTIKKSVSGTTSVTVAIDEYITNIVNSVKVLLTDYSSNGQSVAKEFSNTVQKWKSHADENVGAIAKTLDKSAAEIEKFKLDRDKAIAQKQATENEYLKDIFSNPDLLKKLADPNNADKVKKLSKKSTSGADIISVINSLKENYNIPFNKLLNEAEENNGKDTEEFNKLIELTTFNADDLYKKVYASLQEQLTTIFDTDHSDWKYVKASKEKMEALLKAQSEEIIKRINIICRVGNDGQKLSLGQEAAKFVSSHPLRASGLTKLWANHETDLKMRMNNRLKNNLENGPIVRVAQQYVTQTVPSVLAAMITYKAMASIIEKNSAKMSIAGRKTEAELASKSEHQIDNLLLNMQLALNAYSHYITDSGNNLTFLSGDPSHAIYILNILIKMNKSLSIKNIDKLQLYESNLLAAINNGSLEDTSSEILQYLNNEVDSTIIKSILGAKIYTDLEEYFSMDQSVKDNIIKIVNVLQNQNNNITEKLNGSNDVKEPIVKLLKLFYATKKSKDNNILNKFIENKDKISEIHLNPDHSNDDELDEQIENALGITDEDIDDIFLKHETEINYVDKLLGDDNFKNLFNIADGITGNDIYNKNVIFKICKLYYTLNHEKTGSSLKEITEQIVHIIDYLLCPQLLNVAANYQNDQEFKNFLTSIDVRDRNNAEPGQAISSFSINPSIRVDNNINFDSIKEYLEKPKKIIDDFNNLQTQIPEKDELIRNVLSAAIIFSNINKAYTLGDQTLDVDNFTKLIDKFKNNDYKVKNKNAYKEGVEKGVKSLMEMLKYVINKDLNFVEEFKKALTESIYGYEGHATTIKQYSKEVLAVITTIENDCNGFGDQDKQDFYDNFKTLLQQMEKEVLEHINPEIKNIDNNYNIAIDTTKEYKDYFVIKILKIFSKFSSVDYLNTFYNNFNNIEIEGTNTIDKIPDEIKKQKVILEILKIYQVDTAKLISALNDCNIIVYNYL